MQIYACKCLRLITTDYCSPTRLDGTGLDGIHGDECTHPAVVAVICGADPTALQVRGELVVDVSGLNGQGRKPAARQRGSDGNGGSTVVSDELAGSEASLQCCI